MKSDSSHAAAQRQQTLLAYGVIDSPPEAVFDDLTRLAAQICEAPYGLITFVGEDRQWLKSRVGLATRVEPLNHSFALEVLKEPDILIIPDTHKDPRFAHNPKVLQHPHVRFYAGAVLRTAEGIPVGSLCVLDNKPRAMTPEHKDALLILASQVMAQLELRRLLHTPATGRGVKSSSEHALQEDAAVLETLARVGAELTAELDLDRLLQKITDAATELTGAKFGALFHNERNEEGEVYQLYTLSGAPMEAFSRFPAPRNTHVFGPTFRGEGIVRSADITQDSRFGRNAPYHGLPAGHLPVRSYLAVPVVSRSGEVIGGLLFGHPDSGVFTDRSERLATGIAAQAAIAIDNARLYKLTTGHQAWLEQLVEERTRELEASNQRLQREIEDRKQAEEALRHAQKMDAIGQLTGGVAHDFNNLLQVIGANLQLLEQHTPDDEEAKRRLQAAANAVERGAKLSSQLLAFARRQPLEPRPVNLGQYLRDMDELLRRTLGADIALKIAVAEDAWTTFADPVQVENAVLNLALNARDAMPQGGKLTIEVANAHLDEAYAAYNKEVEPGDYVMLDISDTGSGMSKSVRERVFEPFFTTKGEGRGTGLGLSQVYGFVKQSQGHISIYSEEGHGTSVKLYLPRTLQEEDVSHDEPEGPVEGGTETILVAEDDAEVREATVDMLSELGYHVLKAVDGQGALSVLQSGMPIDLLFSDVVMPGPVKAPELARQAREVQPDIAVLFTSGYTQNAIVHGGRLDPGVDLLGKPYRREQLALKIRHVLRNREQRLRAREAQARKSTAAPAKPAGPALRVLMVEDDRELLDLMPALVAELGHSMSCAASAREALDLLRQKEFDILFTDVGLPDMSGVELARQALDRNPSLYAVFASGYGRNLELEPMPAGRFSVLPKPYGVEDIEQALRRFHSRHRGRAPATPDGGRAL